jgi:tripartite-type tricarboxylate transporter receptor subunit TctC
MRTQNSLVWKWILGLLLITLFTFSSGQHVGLAAENYPVRPVEIIVPFAVGGGFDTVARAIQPWLQETLEAPTVIVNNKTGGRGAMGVAAAWGSKPDGYTLLVTDYTNPALSYLTVEGVGFEWEDLIPLVTVTYDPKYFFVRKDSPYKDMNDLVEDIRQRPGKVTISIPTGSGSHWQTEYMLNILNLNAKTVGYKGGAPAIAAMLGGHVDAFCGEGLARYPIREKLRAIGVVSTEPGSLFPEAPLCIEQRVFKEKGITELHGAEAMVAVWAHRKVKEQHPDRFYKIIAALWDTKEHPGFIEKANALGLNKVMVWYGPQKSLRTKTRIMKAFKEYPEVLKAMMQ